MNQPESATVVCQCCRLDWPRKLSSPIVHPYILNLEWRCRMCSEHLGKEVKKALDHEEEVRARWGGTADALHAAKARGDKYREKMQAAFRSRDRVLKHFEKLWHDHQATDAHGCICGKRNCETLRIVDDDWIIGLVSRMHRREAM